MKDYISTRPEDSRQKNNPILFTPTGAKLITGIVLVLSSAAALWYLLYSLDKTRNQLADPSLPKITGIEEPLDIASIPPPPADAYEFDNILEGENPIRIEREDDFDILENSQFIYYVRVPGYASYDLARNSAIEMISWGISNRLKIEPYSEGAKLFFRLRVGPFVSRSDMNRQRDILYDKEIVNEALTYQK